MVKQLIEVLVGSEVHWVGDGFPVRTIFSPVPRGAEMSPFLLLDYAGPVQVSPTPEPRGVGEHPHRGFETVTIVYQGELEHRDSSGNHGKIGSGDVQWMTAGSGILHEEKYSEDFSRQGGTLEMVQLWVNLPAKLKMTFPRYQTLTHREIPVVNLGEEAGTLRTIAGDFRGTKGPATTFTPINLWDLRLRSGRRIELQLPRGYTTAIGVLNGNVRLNGAETAGSTQLALFSREGDQITVEALEDTTMLVLNGEPIDEPIASHGPFVMNSQGEIRKAILDYQSGQMGRMPAR